MIVPSRVVASGKGKPRLIKEMAVTDGDYYQTAGSPTYTATTVVDSVALDSRVKVGRRIRAKVNNTGFEGSICWAKITAVDTGTKTITVDQWYGATSNPVPTNTNVYTIDGYIADLPRCENLEEVFDPDVNVHGVYKSKKKVKQYGWKYSAKLNYKTFFSPDTAYAMREIMAQATNGSDVTIVFIPRMDKPLFQYNVFFNQSLSVFLHQTQLGHGGVVVSVEGKNNVALPSMFNFGGYGYGYGQNYGVQL